MKLPIQAGTNDLDEGNVTCIFSPVTDSNQVILPEARFPINQLDRTIDLYVASAGGVAVVILFLLFRASLQI